jgi:ABC-2 type transport system ATP-binding protein
MAGAVFLTATMTTPAIEIEQLTKRFGRGKHHNQALHNLSLSIRQADIFGFLGPNGAGKSTTIKLLMGLLRADRGTLTVMGAQVGRQEFRTHVGYLPEFPFFYHHLSAKETLLLSGRLSGLKTQELALRIPPLLQRMDLEKAENRRVGGFSKGMKQRLGMANALIHDPQVLILDEPMSGLDPVGRYHIKELLLELNQQGKTIFFSSHILSDIEVLCNRIAIINKGRLLYDGEMHDFKTSGRSLEEQFLVTIRDHDEKNAR